MLTSDNTNLLEWKAFLKKNSALPFTDLLTGFKKIYGSALPIIWAPEQYPIQSNLHEEIKKSGNTSYPAFYSWSIDKKEGFWKAMIDSLSIKFEQPYSSVLEKSDDPDQVHWLKNARFNIVESCFQAASEQAAIFYQAEQSSEIHTISYGALKQKVIQYASGLSKNGFAAHDRIILYLPFSIDAIAFYLACIYMGAEPVLVSDSFSAQELTKRIAIIKAKAVLTTDQYWYADKKIAVLPKVLEANPCRIILYSEEQSDASTIRANKADLLLSDLLDVYGTSYPPYYHTTADTISILFSSGTTKEPKALPWKAATPIKCAVDGKLLQDIHAGDVVTWTSGMGWMMAPWLIFAALLNKASIAVYGGAYSKKEFLDFTVQTHVTVLGTIPSVVKSWRAQAFQPVANWKVRIFSSTGEPSDAEDYFYLMYLNNFNAPIIEYCGGTEIGGGYISNVVELPIALSSFNTPAPGSTFILLDENKHVVEQAGAGEVFLIPPAIGLSQEILNKSHAEEYYANLPVLPAYPLLRRHGDGFHKTTIEGTAYYRSMGRTDDSMNLGGIKVSAVEIETVVNTHPDIIESAAVALQSTGGGPERLVVFVHTTHETDNVQLQKELQKIIQAELNPLFKIYDLVFKENFPRTASNKLMRKELRKELAGHF
ncbi:AMP-binding protein [Cytophaga hutchinsonii]|uniref:Acetyl-CoA synthetase n=1 Tax=Cytophaga hutchinsonii (strain ATCC 33406 / DSM 1761 / CIP 103989 / NBRC 15051 / NCIMB 9469 / D465) TaxID=269798 RepID=A0A6N4SUQ8_CYTH3|nr:AMP-binding protein [Cytophaga hutchinsonii]ABG60223.1 acetyl-CoA synthetase [Cytophaga hutchinsonii ATCC 33406]SFX21569.1 acetyl-CoA synthetase [Cytophaga hutchinsonii ATCC 33406]